MPTLEQLEKEAEESWKKFQAADAICDELRDLWCAASSCVKDEAKRLDRIKLEEEIRARIAKEQTK